MAKQGVQNASEMYDKLERVGRGSFGEVFKGIYKKTGQLVAIKVLNLDNDEDDIEEIRKEIAVLSRCDSEYVTKYWGSYLVHTKLWIVMDYAGGGSIRTLMRAGPIGEKAIIVIALEVCQALVYLHKSNIIHRDIKAANILLTDDGYVKLCDFGVAGQVTSSSSRRNSFVGTPFWMAPEVIKRVQYDFKADIWSYGITIYEMSNGTPPYADQDPMKAVLLISRNPAARLDASHPKILRDLVELCLNEDAALRPTAEELSKNKIWKMSKSNPAVLRELVTKYQEWIARADSPTDYNGDGERSPIADTAVGPWQFDTVKPGIASLPAQAMPEDHVIPATSPSIADADPSDTVRYIKSSRHSASPEEWSDQSRPSVAASALLAQEAQFLMSRSGSFQDLFKMQQDKKPTPPQRISPTSSQILRNDSPSTISDIRTADESPISGMKQLTISPSKDQPALQFAKLYYDDDKLSTTMKYALKEALRMMGNIESRLAQM